ncbi:AAA family ATPase [uncultured Microbacterium sp.]|uniref:MinD/ParA family ATP-binding protein n=1 Tax=uncultured Microbacterium sp. TaxID=191216 RepID=UPI0035CC6B63
MTPDRLDPTPEGEAENGMLADTGSLDTSAFSILGAATEQVSVSIPADDDDDLDDEGVVDDEVALGAFEAIQSEYATPDEGVRDASDFPPSAETGEIVTGEIEAGEIDTAPSNGDATSFEEVPEIIGEYEPDDDESGRRFEVSEEQSPAPEPSALPAAPLITPPPAAPTPTGSTPTTRREAMHPELTVRTDRVHAVERVHTNPDVALASKRLGEFEAGRESSDLLTPDRLLDPHQVVRPEPEGTWQHLVYSLSRRRINLGDGKRARDRKELDRRISVALPGGARFVPVLSRKGGVGKTTITTLLGMALADARDDRIIAIDANPDRGTLAERIARSSGKTIRDLVRVRADVTGYSDISSIVARDETRLDVLASDADPRVSEALSDRDYHDVAAVAAHYYSIVLTDTGTGIVHSVMGATLDVADQLVIVSGLSVDEARLASETLTWLETNGYAEQARNAVVVLNNARPGAPLVRQDELESHFGTRVRTVVRIPYDPLIGAGSAITFRELQPATRLAARELAAAVVQGLRLLAPAA